ncbi:MAG: hypothetical protein ABIE84_03965 [bacterium]
MNQQLDKNNFDVVSISQPGKTKRSNHIQNALTLDPKRMKQSGQFVKIFSDMFLKKEIAAKRFA